MKAHRIQSKGKVSFLGVSCKTEITLPRRMTADARDAMRRGDVTVTRNFTGVLP